jgi:hypothetical protein
LAVLDVREGLKSLMSLWIVQAEMNVVSTFLSSSSIFETLLNANIDMDIYLPVYGGSNEISSKLDLNDFPQISSN